MGSELSGMSSALPPLRRGRVAPAGRAARRGDARGRDHRQRSGEGDLAVQVVRCQPVLRGEERLLISHGVDGDRLAGGERAGGAPVALEVVVAVDGARGTVAPVVLRMGTGLTAAPATAAAWAVEATGVVPAGLLLVLHAASIATAAATITAGSTRLVTPRRWHAVYVTVRLRPLVSLDVSRPSRYSPQPAVRSRRAVRRITCRAFSRASSRRSLRTAPAELEAEQSR